MAKKNQPASSGDSGGEIMIVFGVVLILFMVWMAYHTKIAALVLGVRSAEAWVISLFTNALTEDRAWMKYVPRSAVTIDDMATISTKVGSYVRWVTVPIMIWFGVHLFRRSPTERFRRRYTDKVLPGVVGGLYPWMRISLVQDFSNMDPAKGPWANPLTERQFARKYKLRNENGEIDRDRAQAVFIKQMGNMFMGVQHMKPHVRALFALFAVRINKDFKTGDALLIQLANTYADLVKAPAGTKPNHAMVDELIEKYLDSKLIKKLIAQHAYERTLLMSMLETARGGENGKDLIPPNWFLWVKGIDRPLWYALSDVGRRTPHNEASGVFAHWLTEKARGKKLEVPYVVNAIEGLIGELKKFTNDDGDHEEGLLDTDEVRDFDDMPAYVAIPSPEEAEKAFKSGKGHLLQRPGIVSNSGNTN